MKGPVLNAILIRAEFERIFEVHSISQYADSLVEYLEVISRDFDVLAKNQHKDPRPARSKLVVGIAAACSWCRPRAESDVWRRRAAGWIATDKRPGLQEKR